MKKCTKGHDMPDAQKRCADCGQAAATPGELVKAVCSGCTIEGVGIHCIECGEPMLKAEQLDADLAAALDELDGFAKANVALSATVTPASAEDDDADLAELLKADTNGDIDALPILEAIRLSQNRVAGTNLAAATETRATRRELGGFMKAYVQRERAADRQTAMLKAEIAGLRDTVAVLAGTPRNHRGRLSVSEQPKNLGGDTGTKPPTIDRDVLLAKAHVALDQEKLSLSEFSQIETWVNQGPHGFALMNQEDPGLYAKCIQAVGEITQ